MNTPETTDVDVETVMGLIRRRVYGLPDTRHIMGEIERAKLKADSILTCKIGDASPKADGDMQRQLTRMSWKNRVKARVAGLIMRAVRVNFRYQEIFNNSVIGVLQLIAEDLYAYERRLGATGRLGEDEHAPKWKFDRAAYEERHIDPKPFCRRSLSLFRELLREDDAALELFCGRGELLAAFNANGIEVVGIDPDEAMVSLCQERGLRALRTDIFEHLRDAPDASYGGIFAWRVIERLTNDEIAELLELAKRKLRHGGLFVASATNIDHLPALRKFYLDPSLVRPVPVKLLAFMLERSGLRLQRFMFSSDGERDGDELTESALSREVYPYDEYTVVAVND